MVPFLGLQKETWGKLLARVIWGAATRGPVLQPWRPLPCLQQVLQAHSLPGLHCHLLSCSQAL